MAVEYTDDRRYLSIGETFNESGNQAKFPYGMFYNVTKFTSKKVITEKMVRKGLRILSNQHYMLRSKLLVDDNEDFYFEEMIFPDDDNSWIPLRMLTETNSFDWVSIMNEENKTGFTDLLWRVIWLSKESLSQSIL